MFGKRLRKVRMDRHLTQQKLAEMIGLALRSYQCYEQGTREPPMDMLIKLSNTLDVSVDYLLGRSDTPNVAVACAIPKELQQTVIASLMGIGITKDHIVQESPRAAVIGEGFIVDEVSPNEAKKIVDHLTSALREYLHSPSKSVDESL